MADRRPPTDEPEASKPREGAPGEGVGPARPIDPGKRPPAPAPHQGDAAQAPTTVQGPAEEPDGAGEPGPPARPARRQRSRSPSAASAVDKVRRTNFPIAMRGYDRASVDAYVAEIAQLVAELEATQLPEAVVQRALDQVGEQTSAILKHAHEASEEITARSRGEADDLVARANREAESARREVEQHARQLEDDTQEVWDERRRLIEDIRHLADDVLALADDALERLPPPGEEPSTTVEVIATDPDEPDAPASTVESPPADDERSAG